MSELQIKCPNCSCEMAVSVRCDVALIKGDATTDKFDREAYQRDYMREYMRKRRGRPSLGSPWKALGISRTAYFAKKKAGELP